MNEYANETLRFQEALNKLKSRVCGPVTLNSIGHGTKGPSQDMSQKRSWKVYYLNMSDDINYILLDTPRNRFDSKELDIIAILPFYYGIV